MGRLVTVNVAGPERVRRGSWAGKPGRSGIDKAPVDGPVWLRHDHVEGDTVADTRHHGGPYQAVYAYAAEDARWWGEQLHRDEPAPGAFGENLTVEGVDVTGAVIGETWAVGGALLQVCVPRIPCRVFAWFWDVPDLILRFTAAGRPGAYLRVLREGPVTAGDAIEVGARPAHGLTIGETFRAMTGDRSLAARLLEAPELPPAVLDSARVWSAKRSATS